MPAPFRSAYFIVRSGRSFAVHHEWHGLILDGIDCLGSAEGHVEELEAEDAERAEDEAATLAIDAADLTLREAA